VLFAAQARKAVLLRRGPKTHYCLIAWDLKDDSFKIGQWMKGHVHLCDLSPDGSTLIYWAAQYHASAQRRRAAGPFDPLQGDSRKHVRDIVRRGRKVPRYLRPSMAETMPRENTGTWTAISTVPWFTALAHWPAYGHWTGGGLFAGSNHIVLFEPQDRMTPVVNVPIPARLRIQSAALADSALIAQRSACGPLFEINVRDPQRAVEDQARFNALELVLQASGLRMIEWVHPEGGDILFAADGAVWRVPGGERLQPQHYLAAARKLADFSALSFQLVSPPAPALRWQI
jgi:hypothetical protein